jgi:hypothetical protein
MGATVTSAQKTYLMHFSTEAFFRCRQVERVGTCLKASWMVDFQTETTSSITSLRPFATSVETWSIRRIWSGVAPSILARRIGRSQLGSGNRWQRPGVTVLVIRYCWANERAIWYLR